jgi:hypothetical protein
MSKRKQCCYSRRDFALVILEGGLEGASLSSSVSEENGGVPAAERLVVAVSSLALLAALAVFGVLAVLGFFDLLELCAMVNLLEPEGEGEEEEEEEGEEEEEEDDEEEATRR